MHHQTCALQQNPSRKSNCVHRGATCTSEQVGAGVLWLCVVVFLFKLPKCESTSVKNCFSHSREPSEIAWHCCPLLQFTCSPNSKICCRAVARALTGLLTNVGATRRHSLLLMPCSCKSLLEVVWVMMFDDATKNNNNSIILHHIVDNKRFFFYHLLVQPRVQV